MTTETAETAESDVVAQVERLAARVATVGLTSAREEPRDNAPAPGADDRMLSEDAWGALVARCHRDRVTGLLVSAVDSGMIAVTEQQWDDLLALHSSILEACLRLEDHLLHVFEHLERAGVEGRVLKGPAVAHLDYPDPSMRTFGDVDLLVRSEQYDEAIAALGEVGMTRRFREVRPGFDRRFGKGACLVGHSGYETDLHRTFVMGPFGLWLDLADVWASSEPFTLAGRTLHGLDREIRFLHACYHAALGDRAPRLSQLRDVAQLWLREPDLDRDRVRALAEAWRGEAVVARAVRLAWDTLGLDDDELSQWAGGYRPDPRTARALRTYLDPEMGYASRSLAAVSAVPGMRSKAAFSWSMAFPDRSYGSGRHEGRWQRWRRALDEARLLVGRRR